jgi:glycosyltransferase involved in cell wall biosynthesis
MERLAARGHQVTVLTSVERLPGVTDPPHEPTSNPAVRRDLVKYFRNGDVWTPSPLTRWKIERSNQRAVAAAIAAAAPDVVTVWHLGALSLGVVTAVIEAGFPIVYGISDDWPAYAIALDPWAKLMDRLGPLKRSLRFIARVPTAVPDLGRSGAFCFISECTRRRCEEFSRWTFPESALVYSGIDRTLFTPGELHRPWRGRLLYVGRFDARKGIECAVRAMALLPGATLEVQGTGDDAEQTRLESLAGQLGVADRIQFARVPRSALPDRYRAADAFIFPSEWEEPFGLVPLEAMACGAPVVATGVGGSGEFLIGGGNCVRFEAGDPASLAAAVESLAFDDALRARLVDEGLRTAAFFDVDRLTDAYEAWFDGAAIGYANGRPPSRQFAIGVY